MKVKNSLLKTYQKFIYRFKRQSFALNKLDLKLNTYIKKRKGVFIEVGANDGITQSNTLFFEKYYGWTGLLIEAVPELASKCTRNRPKCIVENYALVPPEMTNSFVDMEYCNLMSVVKHERNDIESGTHLETGRKYLKANEQIYTVKVPTRTLSEILFDHSMKEIDLLSLDVEGFEAQVLQGIDFNSHIIKYILVEVRDKQKIDSILSPMYRELEVLNTNDSYADILYTLRKSKKHE